MAASIESLKALRAQGIISAHEFVALATELSKQMDTEIGRLSQAVSQMNSKLPSPSPSIMPSPQRISQASKRDIPSPMACSSAASSLMVDEDGQPLWTETCSSVPLSLTPCASSSSMREEHGARARRNLMGSFSASPSLPASRELSPNGCTPTSSSVDASSISSSDKNGAQAVKVFSAQEEIYHRRPNGPGVGNASFVRYGSAQDFINASNVKISYRRLKPGTKRVWEQHERWVPMDEVFHIKDKQDGDTTTQWSQAAKPPAQQSTAASTSSTTSRFVETNNHADAVHIMLESLGPLPELAKHERKRVLPSKKEAHVRGRQTAKRRTIESKISIQDRLRQFEGNSLVEQCNEIFCQACKFAPANKWSSINSHCTAPSHKAKLVLWERRNMGDVSLAETLAEHFKQHPQEILSSLRPTDLVYRYKVMETFMASGTPPERIGVFRTLLERSGISIGSWTHLKLFIPKIEEHELTRLKTEMQGQFVSTQFDGTTRLGEAINVVNRWCTAKFELMQRLTLFQTTLTHVNAPKLAALIGKHLMTTMQVRVSRLQLA